jgi:hypothetical protein
MPKEVYILGGIIIIFVLSFLLNRNTKMPEGTELPEECNTCKSASCMIKVSTVEDRKNQLKQYLEEANQCEKVEK